MGSWANSSGDCAFRASETPYHLIVEFCSHPTLWLDGSNDIQYMMDNSDDIIYWWLRVKHLVSTKAQ